MNKKCVIIDDEKQSRELIKEMIKDNFSDLVIAGTGFSVLSGIKVINTEKPEIVLLDIELPDGTGFDILENCSDLNYKVVFITAYDEYAIKAFKYSAVDYILKPVNVFELIKSVNKALSQKQGLLNYKVLADNILKEHPTKLAIHNMDEIIYINVNEIVSIKGEGRYSVLKMENKKEYTDSKILSYFEDILDDRVFVRIHKSYLINLRHVVSYKKSGSGSVKMSDHDIFNISRQKKDLFKEKMNNI